MNLKSMLMMSVAMASLTSAASVATPDTVRMIPTNKMVPTSSATSPGNSTDYPQQKSKSLQLSLPECIEIALNDNPTIRVADLEIQRVNYARSETKASLWPSIDFSAAYQRTIRLQTISMNMGGQSQELKMGTDNTWNFGFSASLPIIAPTLWKAIQISQTQILSSLEQSRQSRLDLVNNVNKAYYSLLLAIASYDVIKENYDVTKLNAELYKKRFENGTASEYDVLRSEVQVKNIEPELLRAQISISQCKLQLKVLMGIADDVDIQPTITLKDMQRDMYGYAMERELSLADNSSLRSLNIQSKLLEQNVQLKKMAYIPTLGAAFSMSWNALSNGNALKNQNFHPYSNVGLQLSVPLFSGGSKYYGIKQAEVQLQEIGLQRDYLTSSLQMQVDLAIDNINMEAKQIETSAEGVRQAEKAHQIMQKSFEMGVATYLDLRDVELAETSSKLAYYQAIYNYLISSSDLDLLLGRDNYLNK